MADFAPPAPGMVAPEWRPRCRSSPLAVPFLLVFALAARQSPRVTPGDSPPAMLCGACAPGMSARIVRPRAPAWRIISWSDLWDGHQPRSNSLISLCYFVAPAETPSTSGLRESAACHPNKAEKSPPDAHHQGRRVGTGSCRGSCPTMITQTAATTAPAARHSSPRFVLPVASFTRP